MKKIVGIIAALALAGAVFADEPSVAPVVAEFDGNAKIEWVYNLDAETFGFKNAEEATFKIKFVTEGTKETEGEGLWGELQIKAGSWEAKYGDGLTYKNPFKAKVKNADGDEKVWDFDPETGKYTDDKGDEQTPASIVEYPYKESLVAMPGGASVEVAKIHFVDGDFYVHMNIKKPDFKLSGGAIDLATSSGKDYPTAKVTLDDAAGFTINLGLDGLFDANVKFADNGVKKSSEKKYAFGADVTVKAVEGLDLYAGFAYSTQTKKSAFAAKAAYKIGITDTMYVKPAVGFALGEDEKKALNAGVLFGWGTEGQSAGFEKFTKAGPAHANGDHDTIDSVPDKCADGVSVFVAPNIEDSDKGIDLLVGAYDSVLLAGLSDALAGFKIGAQFKANTKTISDAFTFDAALAYSNTFDIWKFSANFGFKLDKTAAGTNNGVLFGAGIETDGIIENTTLYAKYKGQQAEKIGGINEKGSVTVGAKIHF